MTAKELRDAAERVKLVYSDEGLCQSDIESITAYILANVQEDGVICEICKEKMMTPDELRTRREIQRSVLQEGWRQ